MNCVIQSIKSKHFLLSKGMYKWDSVYSLNILCLHTCISQEWFIVKQILDLEVRTSPPLFFWHRPALGGCPASGGRHMATALLWGSTSDHYQAMTHHLARGYGQKITEAIFLGNSFYLHTLAKPCGPCFSPGETYAPSTPPSLLEPVCVSWGGVHHNVLIRQYSLLSESQTR